MRRSRKAYGVAKPHGSLSPRVQAVGPEHFGIVCVDVAKLRSKFAFFDFYGKVLLPPTVVEHTAPQLQHAIARIRSQSEQHHIRDLVVAIEMTGTYHRHFQRACQLAQLETRLVHPHASRQFRQPADPDYKTDDADIAAIFRAAQLGFGLLQPIWPELYLELQALRRHRRDLVDKNADLQRQLHEVLHASMPGYAPLFCHFWDSDTPMSLARFVRSAAGVLELGIDGLKRWADQARVRVQQPTLHKVLQWAQRAPATAPHLPALTRRLDALDDDRRGKCREILAVERDLAPLAARTPYILLLAIPGINLVSVADLAGELGPIELYPNANAITGRAGLRPCRYQSDQVDRDGPLLRQGNRRLRAVLMQTASNLVTCNHYFQAAAKRWTDRSAVWVRVKVAKILTRLLYQIVPTKRLLHHPCLQQDHYIVQKLTSFLNEHQAQRDHIDQTLTAALAHFDVRLVQREERPLRELLDLLAQQRRGPQPVGDLIDLILTRLRLVQSETGAGPPA